MRKRTLKTFIIIFCISLFMPSSTYAKELNTNKNTKNDVIKLELSEKYDIIYDNNKIGSTPETKADNSNSTLLKANINKNTDKNKTNRDSNNLFKSNSYKNWEFVKGQPVDDSIMLDMFSYHTRPDRDQMNESNKLAAIDFKGYSVGTFNNSYHIQTYYAGISRKVFEKKLPLGINFDCKYKLIALHGYARFEPDIKGITPLIIPMIGFSRGYMGIDFLASPGKTITFATNFRINLKNK